MYSEILDEVNEMHRKIHKIDNENKNEKLNEIAPVISEYENAITDVIGDIKESNGNKKKILKALKNLESELDKVEVPTRNNNSNVSKVINLYKSIITKIRSIRRHLPSHGGSRRVKRGKRSTRRLR
jgi:chromosome segregation ATPase